MGNSAFQTHTAAEMRQYQTDIGPTWNHEHWIQQWLEGDDLQFTVLDKATYDYADRSGTSQIAASPGVGGDVLVGHALLKSSWITWQRPFDGWLKLMEPGSLGSLRVKVARI